MTDAVGFPYSPRSANMSPKQLIEQSNQAYAARAAVIEGHIASGNIQALEELHRQSFGYHAAQLILKTGRFNVPANIKPVLR